MRKKLAKLAKLRDRFGVSDKAGAAIATVVLEDFGTVSHCFTKSTNVIDWYKLRCKQQLKQAIGIKKY